jgi:hypothetical protein
MMKRVHFAIHLRWLVGVLFLTLNVVVFAQQQTSQPPQTKPSPMVRTAETAQPPGKPIQTSPPVSPGQALYLVRSTLMMLDDANRSGNYTVLRDLAAPDFQARNSSADLAQSFFDLRRRKFELFAVALLTPQFSTDPSLDSNGRVRLMGYFPTRPQQIKFDLTFQSVGGQWKLFAISVATPEAPKDQSLRSHPPSPSKEESQLSDSPSRPKAKPFYGFQLFRGTAGWRW